MLQLNTVDEIIINGRPTGLRITQTAAETKVYTPENLLKKVPYCEHPMPHRRYSSAHDFPASGAAGRSQLEADVLALLSRLG